MGLLPASPHNKINVHVGGAYGDRAAALARFCQVLCLYEWGSVGGAL